MWDNWADHALDQCGSDYGRPLSGRFLFKLVFVYIILGTMCHTEQLFRAHSLEVEAKVETVGEVRGGGRRPQECLLIRYHYHDPATGQLRQNTVQVPKTRSPVGPTTTIEYIPGQPPRTRLKEQARPILISVFFWLNVLFALAIAGLIGMIAWEANHPIARSSERRSPAKRL